MDKVVSLLLSPKKSFEDKPYYNVNYCIPVMLGVIIGVMRTINEHGQIRDWHTMGVMTGSIIGVTFLILFFSYAYSWVVLL